ncbi:hypothetical protein QJS10_CPB13g00109 [Acorus calamus]|uniref:Thaumatin-like protein n=1 Tax=Acorus calamus TaxID=4465 RepID=A0AAV9DIG4_ACOCL|nr:hypothetical protein QJS10_CPB13g00109 [Acorus calamus]
MANLRLSLLPLMALQLLKKTKKTSFSSEGHFRHFAGCTVTPTTATVFTIKNLCNYTIWPATISGNGATSLGGGGFPLPAGASTSLSAPSGWSGRFWARTGCLFDSPTTTSGNCTTGDCAGNLHCTVGGVPPVTLAEFTLASDPTRLDFYDVSLVDGYNVGVSVTPSGSDTCPDAGCVGDVNDRCPEELRVVDKETGVTVACKSACEAFGGERYCCTGSHASPGTCGPSEYSRLFKAACPRAYSYAYDDASSTCTCKAGADYVIEFCPVA